MRHPMQELIVDQNGFVRFRQNQIVKWLLVASGNDMNDLAAMDFSDQDREQLAQLIGYSVSGFADLPYASPETITKAAEIAEGMV